MGRLREAQARHARFYLGRLDAAEEQYERGGAGIREALADLDAEWANIQAGQTWAQTNTALDTEAARLTSDYRMRGGYILELRQHPRDQMRWCESAITAAIASNDKNAEASHLRSLGNVHSVLGNITEAMRLYESALAITRQTGDLLNEARVLNNLGHGYVLLGRYREGIP